MSFIDKKKFTKEGSLISLFFKAEFSLILRIGTRLLGWSGYIKDVLTKLMYRQRGRFSQSFVNISMAGMTFLAIAFSGRIEQIIIGGGGGENVGSNYLIMAADGVGGANTLVSELPKGEITEYRVMEGDTISSIAAKFGVSIDTIMWENELKNVDAIKPQQILRILPITGVKYKVKRGETIYSISKAHSVDAQNIVDYPFNTFANDETFSLVAGQEIMIPDGVKPKVQQIDTARYAVRTVAAIPGVVGEGNFMWPTSGKISQRYYWYHRAVDIASREGPTIVASQGGTVITAGWNAGGYGNYVVIDHGNGYQTLYGHMLANSVVVQAGQKVSQGQKIGIMGSTGRSTGPHLHFEVIGPSGKLDPLAVLK